MLCLLLFSASRVNVLRVGSTVKRKTFLLFYRAKMATGGMLRFSRNFTSQQALRASLSEPLKATEPSQHAGGYKMWRNLFFLVCCPAMGVGYLNVALNDEHKRPEFVKYSHLRIRNKKYAWRDGVKTLFHNPHVNALPDGYEESGGHH